MFCRQRLAQLEQAKDQIQAAGLRLVVVGIGEPKHAERYCPQLAPSAECAATPDASAHRAFGFERGGLTQLAWLPTLQAGAKASAQGFSQGAATGDVSMLGGLLLVDQAGQVRFAHYDAYAGDAMPLTEALAAAPEPHVRL